MLEWVFHVSVLPYCLFTCVKLDLSDCLAFTCVFCNRQMMDPSWKNQDLVLWLPLVRNRLLLEHWIGLEGTNSTAMPYAKFTNNVDTFNCLFFPLYLMSTMQIGLEHYGNYLLFCSSILAMASMIVCCVNGSLFPS